MKFVRVEPFSGCIDLSDDFVPDSSVLGWVGVEEPVALTEESFDAGGHPRAISYMY